MHHMAAVLYWLAVNVLIGVFGSVIVGSLILRYDAANRASPGLRHFYRRGELGLIGVVIALGALGDVAKAPVGTSVLGWCIGVFAVLAFLSAYTWSTPICYEVLNRRIDLDRVWKDSLAASLLVFSTGLIVETILEMKA
jgi:O-antigen/teichoic acid export membrane protein